MPDLQILLDRLQSAYTAWGYPIVFLGALLENMILLGVVLPGGTLVLLGAVYAQQGAMVLPAVLAPGWAGMVAGTSLDYVLGRWGLHSVLQRTGMMARLAPRLAEAELRIRSRSNW